MRLAHLRLMQTMLLAPEGTGGGAGGATEVEVDLPGGVKVKLPKEQADKVIAGRDSSKSELRTLNERLGAVEAEKRAAEEKAAAALREKEAADAMKAGDIKKLEELHTAKLRSERDTLGAKLRDKALAAMIAATPKLVPQAIEDITAQLRARTRYDFDSDSLIVLDAAGQPLKDDSGKAVAVDAYVGKWLGDRPYYLLDSSPSGSGAAGTGKPPSTIQTIRRAEYKHNDAEQARKLALGQLKIVD